MQEFSLFPEKYRILSGSTLKVIAVVTMIIDHIGAYFPRPTAAVVLFRGILNMRLYTVLRFIGRLSFPIFCFLLVEGYLHTHDRKKYGIRLFLFALISELPWNLVHTGTLRYAGQNVFFTLFLAYLGLCVAGRIEKGEESTGRGIALMLALLITSNALQCDYGSSGFGFVLMLYLLRRQQLFQAVVGSCMLSSRWQAGLAFIPIGLYNGRRGFLKGRLASILFYLIYPLQLMVFWWVRTRTTGF